MDNQDLWNIGRVVVLTLVAWLTPPRLWRRAARATCWLHGRSRSWPSNQKVLANKFPESEIAGIIARLRYYMRELSIQILGLNGPWCLWRPEIRLNGTTYLQEALKRGQGAILWVTETAFSTLIVKMALHYAGYQVVQLSRPGHGFSASKFGIRFLNPIWTRVEDRFIAERVLIMGESAADALSILRARLSANQIVVITVGPQARKFANVRFFSSQIKIPTGPMRLAKSTGAALLPVFTVARDDGAFDVTIGEALNSGEASDEHIAAAYAERLERFVLAYPDQWRGWQHGSWFMDD